MSSVLIFKEIEREAQSVLQALASEHSESDEVDLELKLKLIRQLVRYVRSMKWLRHKQARKKVRLFLDSQYNYTEVAFAFGVSVASLQVTVSYASTKLRKRTGSLLRLLQANKLAEAERELALVTGVLNPQSYFISGVLDVIRPHSHPETDLSLCKQELRLLRFLSVRNIQGLIGKCDRNRLEHLLYLVFQGDVAQRSILTQYLLEGKMNDDEVLSAISTQDFWSQSTL